MLKNSGHRIDLVIVSIVVLIYSFLNIFLQIKMSLSHAGKNTVSNGAPLPAMAPFSASPVRLLYNDFLLFLKLTFTFPFVNGLPSIVLPILPFRSGGYDEFYPTYKNLWSLWVQIVLFVVQSIFILLLIPAGALLLPLPLNGLIYVGAVGLFVLLNKLFTDWALNGYQEECWSDPRITQDCVQHDSEVWIFVNGVAAGRHWLQSNVDRLALTFRRPIHGVHNKTRGILFDVIECTIQRCFRYDTADVRTLYKCVAAAVTKKNIGKVVMIMHSQGAIEGGMVLDALYAMLPAENVGKIEVYTFGNAANHFNSPEQAYLNLGAGSEPEEPENENHQLVPYIEHYANTRDWVSRFGVLRFRQMPNLSRVKQQSAAKERGKAKTKTPQKTIGTVAQLGEMQYVGRLFLREESGHQLNGNYLDNFFTMDQHLTIVQDGNAYMDMLLDEVYFEQSDTVRLAGSDAKGGENDHHDSTARHDSGRAAGYNDTQSLRIKDVSRLWTYRNGGTPAREVGEMGVITALTKSQSTRFTDKAEWKSGDRKAKRGESSDQGAEEIDTEVPHSPKKETSIGSLVRRLTP